MSTKIDLNRLIKGFDSRIVYSAEGRIYFGESQSWDRLVKWAFNHASRQDLTITMKESKSGGLLDIKTRKGWTDKLAGPMTGRLLNGEYATARSAGNYLAGMNGMNGTFQCWHISGVTYMKIAGAYQVLGGKGFGSGIAVITALQFDGIFGPIYGPAPYYGESKYSGRWIQNGIDAIGEK